MLAHRRNRFLCTLSVLALLGTQAQPQTAAAKDQSQTPPGHAAPGPSSLRQAMNTGDFGQDAPVTLIADELHYDAAARSITARGQVELRQNGRLLEAPVLIYALDSGTVRAEGLVRLTNTDGSIITAENAQLDRDLDNAVLENFRGTFRGGGRLAAVEGRRLDGNITVLTKAVYSPCPVCVEEPDPTWQLRARRVIHDQAAGDIIYEDARLDVLGVPIGFLPFFRHPDPMVDRRSGFLTPQSVSNQHLGFGIKTPYHLALAPDQDLTLTPFVMTNQNPVLEAEYRRLLEGGQLRLSGSATYSELDDDYRLRGHISAAGSVAARQGGNYGFDVNLASDDAYLRQYRYTNTDRLTSRLYYERFGMDGFESVEALRFQSFRDDEPSGEIPLVAPYIEWARTRPLPGPWGDVTAELSALQLYRTEGRDVSRLTLGAGWRARFVHDAGFVLQTQAQLEAAGWYVQDDAVIDRYHLRALPMAAAELRYPLVRRDKGALHLLEPVAQLVVAPNDRDGFEVVNEDSLDAELDETNLFALNRFPGRDRIETGQRLTLGLRYEHIADEGLNFDVMAGRSFRLRPDLDFPENSGLQDAESDFVTGFTLRLDPDLRFQHRARFDQELRFSRNEAYVDYRHAYGEIQLGYAYLRAEPEAGSPEDREELQFAGSLQLNRHWALVGGARADLTYDRLMRASAGLRYTDDCTVVEFRVSRRFYDTGDIPASTDLRLLVRLTGLGDKGEDYESLNRGLRHREFPE